MHKRCVECRCACLRRSYILRWRNENSLNESSSDTAPPRPTPEAEGAATSLARSWSLLYSHYSLHPHACLAHTRLAPSHKPGPMPRDGPHRTRPHGARYSQRNQTLLFLDMEKQKAFDRCSWDYLTKALKELSFGVRRRLLSYVKLFYSHEKPLTQKINVNGHLGDSFPLASGVARTRVPTQPTTLPARSHPVTEALFFAPHHERRQHKRSQGTGHPPQNLPIRGRWNPHRHAQRRAPPRKIRPRRGAAPRRRSPTTHDPRIIPSVT